MRNYIRHLRTKPEETKKQIVLIALVVCMSIVITIWLATLGGRKDSENKIKTKEDNGPSPFSILTNSFSNTFSEIKSSIGEINIGGLKEDLLKEQQEIDRNTESGENYREESSQAEEVINDNFNTEE